MSSMCGRFAVDKSTNDYLEGLVDEHGPGAIRDWQQYWPPNYNVAPTDRVAVAREVDGVRSIAGVRWGMVSSSSPTFGGGKPVINARIETVATNGLFKRSFATRRCVVPALGYYEWQQRDDGKQPFFIRQRGGEPMGLAGIVGAWRDHSKDDDDPDAWRLSMSVITLDAHVTPGEVHDRMPAFLHPEAVDDWLGDTLATPELLRLLDGSSAAMADTLEFYEVSRSVNKVQVSKGVANNGPELIEPVAAVG